MELADFAAMTRRIVARDGFDDFVPVACFPLRRNVRALAGVPSGISLQAAVLEWARNIAEPGEEFLVAFKHSSSEVKMIRVLGALSEEQLLNVVEA